MSELVTYCVLPLARRDDGMIVPDDLGLVECANAEAAARLAEAMAHTHGYVAALAFVRSGSPAGSMARPWCSSTQARCTGVLSDKLGSIDWRMYPRQPRRY